MKFLIQHVPAIKRLSLTGIGCWNNLVLDFIPTLNIITGMGGCGKSTIMRSILNAINPVNIGRHCLMPTFSFTSGQIEIEFYKKAVTVDIPALNKGPIEPDIKESLGQFMLKQLHSNLNKSHQGIALLIEAEITSCLDDMQYHQAVELLYVATNQIICIIHNVRFSSMDFPNARVYNCYADIEGNTYIKLQ